jgi:hypothetical protein
MPAQTVSRWDGITTETAKEFLPESAATSKGERCGGTQKPDIRRDRVLLILGVPALGGESLSFQVRFRAN